MASEHTSGPSQRVLVVAGARDGGLEWLSSLQERGQVRFVASMDEARAALGREQFDLILCPAPELLPLASRMGREEARMILNGIGQGVCSVDREGKLLWTNAAMQTYPEHVIDAVRQACAGFVTELEADDSGGTRRRMLSVPEQYAFDLSVSMVKDAAGRLDRVVGLVCDTSAVMRMREKLDAIDAAGQELVALEAGATRMEVPERLQRLEDNLIRLCRDLLDFTHFAVLVLDPQTNKLDTVLAGGFPEEARRHDLRAGKEGGSISGYVAATGQSYICPDITKDPLYLSGFECARSSLTVPLRLNERVVGVLNVESDQPAAFTDEDRQVAEIFGRYIAVALHMLKLLAVERSETTGQLAADVRAEVSEPLNNIIAEATHLLHDHPDAEEARQRLQAVIANVDRARQALQVVTKPAAIRGLAPEIRTAHPSAEGKRVLVADDEEIIRETISELMSKAGALPVMARDGEEAIAMIESQHFDLVLSDIKMPHRNGYEVFAAARRVSSACPVILITGFGYDPEHSIVRASREGLAGVLFKPFKVEQLMELIEKALASNPD